MTNNQIHYMVEVARVGSVNQAARNLFISQSSLSNAIQSVETEFGRKIFNRSAKGMTLTAFGRQFIAYITPIDRQLQQLYTMRTSSPLSGQHTLSVVSNGFYYISDIVASLSHRWSENGLLVFLREDYSGNVLDAVVNGEADLAVVRIWSCFRDQLLGRFLSSGLLYHPIRELRIGVDVGPKSPLYHTEDDTILPEQLAGYPQIMDESIAYGPYSDILSRIGLPVEPNRFVVNSRASTYELLMRTNGYVLNSRREQKSGMVLCGDYEWRFLPFRDCAITSEIGWLSKEDSILSEEVRAFIHQLQNQLLYIESSY